MTQHVTFKVPRTRKAAKFIVYPHSKGDKHLKLQSDNHCIIANVETNMLHISKRFNQYPRFEYCTPALGGTVMPTPDDVKSQLDTIVSNPTGSIVTL